MLLKCGDGGGGGQQTLDRTKQLVHRGRFWGLGDKIRACFLSQGACLLCSNFERAKISNLPSKSGKSYKKKTTEDSWLRETEARGNTIWTEGNIPSNTIA